MEVILNSEIARLVLGYLKDQNLDSAHRKFCKTSKYLKDEYELLCRGYKPVCVSNSNLVEIIKEYCEVKSLINQFINMYPNEILGSIQSQSGLTKRLEFILQKAKVEVLRKADATQIKDPKRKRSISITSCTSDTECTDIDSSIVMPPPTSRRSKMLKLAHPRVCYTMLNSKDKHLSRTLNNSFEIDDYDDSRINSPAADLTAFKDSILENTKFQNKLADNINKALESTGRNDGGEADKENDNAEPLQRAINEAIENIISTMEQDPLFEDIVQDVVFQQNIQGDVRSANATNVGHTNESSNSSNAISVTSTPKKIGAPDMAVSNLSNKMLAEQSSTNSTQSIMELMVQEACQESPIEPAQIRLSPEKPVSTEIALPHANKMPILNTMPNNNSHLIITPISSTIPFVQFNSNTPQIPFILSSINESNVTFPFVVNSSPCVPTTSQYPVKYVTKPKPQIKESMRPIRGRPRKIKPPIPPVRIIKSIQPNTLKVSEPPIVEPVKAPAVPTLSSLPILNSPMVTASNTKNGAAIQNTLFTTDTKTQQIDQQNTKTTLTTQTSSTMVGDAVTTIKTDALPQTASKTILTAQPPASESVTDMKSTTETTAIEPLKLDSTKKLPEDNPPTNIPIDEPDTSEQENIAIMNQHIVTTGLKEIKQSTTPTQNRKPIENLRVKSNSTPRRKHVRTLDFTTPGKSDRIQPLPKTIERSVDLKSNKVPKIGEMRRHKSDKQTIEKVIEPSEEITATPKVKKNASKCVRVLSRSASEEDNVPKKENSDSNAEKKNPQSLQSGVGLSPMDKWKQLRTISQTNNWDSYLRQVAAEDNLKRIQRQAEQRLAEKAEDLARKNMKKMLKENQKKITPVKRLKKSLRKSPRLKMKQKQTPAKKFGNLKKATKKNDGNVEKMKATETKVVKIDKTDPKPDEPIKQPTAKDKPVEEIGQGLKVPEIVINEGFPMAVSENNAVILPLNVPQSMASLLETPFKSDGFLSNPKTPRFLPPLAVEDTPLTKILKSLTKHCGSALKTDILTPNFAITPGFSSTPPKTLDKMTPQSGAFSTRLTDYSSGSSYYRPDESDDKIETLAALTRSKSSIHEFEYENSSFIESHGEPKNEIQTVTVSNEKIVVQCPGVLEKVKSFSDTSNPLPDNVVPHYTFNVPVANEEQSEDGDSDGSCGSSCTCSSRSSSSSSSCSNKSDVSYHPKNENQPTASKIIDEGGEIRYPIRTWITPKKQETQLQDITEEEKKSCTSTLLTTAQQIIRNELEEKRIRMRETIKVSESKNPKTKKSKTKSEAPVKTKPANSRNQSAIKFNASKPSTSTESQTMEKMKQPRKNPTPKKHIPPVIEKSEPEVVSSVAASLKDDINELISVLSDKNNSNVEDQTKNMEVRLTAPTTDVPQNNDSDDDDEDDDLDECELVSQTDVISIVYDEKSAGHSDVAKPNAYENYLQSSKGYLNVNIDGRKIQIKASDLVTLFERVPPIKENLPPSKIITANARKTEVKKSDQKSKYNQNDKYHDSGESSKARKEDKRNKSRQLHKSSDKERPIKVDKTPKVTAKLPELNSPAKQSCPPAHFNLKYKIPVDKSIKKPVYNRPIYSGSVSNSGAAARHGNAEKPDKTQSQKIEMKNKIKPSSTDRINAVLAHLHGTE